MKVTVIGAGAIGSVVASYLSDIHEVTLVAKIFQFDDIKRSGITVEGVRGKGNFKVKASASVGEGQNLVIICTKTQDIEMAVKENLPALKDALVLTSQNGVSADVIISKLLPRKNLLSSIVMFGATSLEMGKVVHNFEGDWVIGSFFNESKDKLPFVKDVLSEAFKVVISEDIQSMKWTKLFVNFNNCLPALLGKSMQETFSNLEICKISIRLISEGLSVVDRAGINLVSLPDFDINKFRGLASLAPEKAAGIFSNIMKGLSSEPLYGSILQSIKKGRASEIDYINGEVVRLGKEKSIPAPLNERVVAMVKQVEKTKKFMTVEEIIHGTSN